MLKQSTPSVSQNMISVNLLLFFLTSGVPCAEKALYGGDISVTFSYPSGGGSNDEVLKIYQ